jgi:hypothetical protein
MALVPTIEAQISQIWHDWIAAGEVPPFRAWTARTVARHESNAVRPLWKERLVWPFIEAHSGCVGAGDRDIENLMLASEAVCLRMGVPVVPLERLRRPGVSGGYALRRLELGTIMPTGEVTILTSVYDLGTRFSEAFDVRSGRDLLTMVNYACSARMILALIGHSLIEDGYPAYHPSVAPVQIGVISAQSGDAPTAADLATAVSALGIRAESYAGVGNLDTQRTRASRHGAPIVLTVSGRSVLIALRAQGTSARSATVPLGETVAAIGGLWTDVLRICSQHCLDQRATLVRHESAPGKGYMCAVPLCDSATCVTNMLDTGSFDVLGRPWPSPWALGGSEPKCHICGNATDLEVLLGQKVAGEK